MLLHVTRPRDGSANHAAARAAQERTMELYQLKAFVTVAEERHLTRAAERLFTSQPAVSAQIKALEDELGVQLFQRTPKGMRLTPEGERLRERAHRTLEVAGELLDEARRLQDELVGELRLGVHTDFDFLRLDALHADLAAAHPGLRVAFVGSMSARVIQEVRKGGYDAGFLFGPCRSADLAVHHLTDVALAVAVPARWRERVVAADLATIAGLPWIYASRDCPFSAVMQALLEPHGYTPRNVVVVDNEDAIRSLVRAEAGVALMRDSDVAMAEAQGYACRWHGDIPPIALQFVTQARRAGEPAIAALTAAVLAAWPDAGDARVSRSAG
jgi:DNA-binding transcriptional LysR family regulator